MFYPCNIDYLLFVYSGKDRNLNIVELLCASCLRWYHESCIGYQLGKLVPFMMNYFFVCKNCSPTGLENFKKNQAREYKYSDICTLYTSLKYRPPYNKILGSAELCNTLIYTAVSDTEVCYVNFSKVSDFRSLQFSYIIH